jgi:hypothetical protein
LLVSGAVTDSLDMETRNYHCKKNKKKGRKEEKRKKRKKRKR